MNRSWLAVAGASLAACVMLPPLGPWLESDMARHMLLQWPALVMAGVCLAPALPASARRQLATANEHGASGLFLAWLVLGFWMVPRAVDLSLVSTTIALAKYASLLAAGVMLRLSWRPAGTILQLFFIGNWAWMNATVGLLFQQTPSRLCNAYLMDGQRIAGEGLVLLAVVVPAACLLGMSRSGWNCSALGRSKRNTGRLC